MEVSTEDLPEDIIPIGELLDRVCEGRHFIVNDGDEELLFDLPLDEESLDRLKEQSVPFGDPRY
jgi:hypothetical protein